MILWNYKNILSFFNPRLMVQEYITYRVGVKAALCMSFKRQFVGFLKEVGFMGCNPKLVKKGLTPLFLKIIMLQPTKTSKGPPRFFINSAGFFYGRE